MKAENLIVNVLGDSITEGSAASKPENCFVGLLKNKYGFKKVNGFGVGGTRIARKRVPSAVAKYDECFLDRFEKMGDADIVIVFGGTNDWGHGDCLLGNTDDEDEYIFCGAVNSLINKLQARYPNSYVFFITPLHRKNDENVFGEGRKTVQSAPLSAYVDALRSVLEKRGIPYLDLFNDADMCDPSTLFEKILFRDGVHPCDYGHSLIAEKIVKFLAKNNILE